MYERRTGFWVAYALVGTLLFAAAAAFLGWTAFGQQVRVDVKTVPEPALTAAASVADVRGRFQEAPQTMSGEQAGQAVAQSCPKVDIYQQKDGAVLICHG